MTSNYKAHQRRFISALNSIGTDILLEWTTLTGTTVDAPTGAVVGTPTVESETVKGIVHFPDYASRVVTQFAEIEIGDCIVDLAPDVVIEGRDNLTFTINGERWQQKKVGSKLARAWDVVQENTRFCRTIFLRKAT